MKKSRGLGFTFTAGADIIVELPKRYALVAQLDRVTDSDSVGRTFESCRAYQNPVKSYDFTGFLYKENRALDAWFRRAYGDEQKILLR